MLHGVWSSSVDRVDWAIVAVSLVLAIGTLYVFSVPVVGTGAMGLLSILWPATAVAWALALLGTLRTSIGRVAAALLALGFVASIGGIIPFFVALLIGPIGLITGGVLALGLFALILAREPSRRLAWLPAPTIVIATSALLLLGLPSLVRLALSEPDLTAFAQRIERGESVAHVSPDAPILVGSIPILEVDADTDVVRFVTAYVGILGDYRAGLAYAPSGAPSGVGRYEHLMGPWYRWFEVG